MLHLSYKPPLKMSPVDVPGSKSIANRLLVLKHLYFPNLEIIDLPASTDTLYLSNGLNQLASGKPHTLDARDGGTTFRFLIAVLAANNANASITGSPQLLARPHESLTNALNQAGFRITGAESGFQIHQTDLDRINNVWTVDVSKSSQPASALAMIAPFMPKPISIQLEGQSVSPGYLEMTIALMKHLGLQIQLNGSSIRSEPTLPSNDSKQIRVEADWSSISYFVSIAAISKQAVCIKQVQSESIQPDIATLRFAEKIGVNASFESDGLVLQPNYAPIEPTIIERNYTNCPDLFPAEFVCSRALGMHLRAEGTGHLIYKESNRIQSLAQEMAKFELDTVIFESHDDHRVAMSLAPLAILKPIKFRNPEVVSKSFPDFWSQLERLGFKVRYD